jgi:pimeloyl-ACP methyl ester carboxylesterase
MTYQPRRAPRHQHIDVRGLKYRLTWWGAPSDSPIVLLHGLQDCGDTWQFLVDCLPDTWSLVAPDWRGFGGSDWAPGGYWFPDYLADLECLLDILTPHTPTRVIGHSMGANIAALYGGVRPQRLKWFVNLEGVGLRRTQPADAPARYAQWLDELTQPLNEGRYTSVQQLARVLMSRNPRLTADRASFVARAWTRDIDPERHGTQDPERRGTQDPAPRTESKLDTTNPGPSAVDLTPPSPTSDPHARGVRLAFDPRHRFVNPVLYRLEEAEACWSRVEAPMLLLAGGNSGHLERRLKDFNDDRVHTLFRDAKIVTLPGLGHMMHHEDPQAVATQIIDFARTRP